MTKEKIVRILQIALGINFLWFGTLKFFPGFSPAEGLAISTIDWMFQGLIPSDISIKLLAIWEVTLGITLIGNILPKYILPFFIVHMSLTFLPLFIFPKLCFTHLPYALTIEGQYIVKNLILLSAGILLYIEVGLWHKKI